jgi:hypothetical protein
VGRGIEGTPARRRTFVCSLIDGAVQSLKGGGAAAAFTADGKAIAVADGPNVRLVEISSGKTLSTTRIAAPGTRDRLWLMAIGASESQPFRRYSPRVGNARMVGGHPLGMPLET